MRKRKTPSFVLKTNPRFKRVKRPRTTTGVVSPRLIRTGGSLAPGGGPDELKFNDKIFDVTAAYLQTGSILPLNNMNLGTDSNQRIGRRINMKSILMRYILDSDFTQNVYFRTMVVIDMQTNAALPTWLDIFTEQSAVCLNNLNNRDRFRIILDRQEMIEAGISGQAVTGGNSNAGGPTIVFNKAYKKMNYTTTYNQGNNGTIADIQTGSLLLCTIATVTGVGSGGYSVQVRTRIRFTDP